MLASRFAGFRRLSRVCSIVVALGVVVGTSPARADDAGASALTAAEAAMNKGQSHYFEYEATTVEPKKSAKKIGLAVHIKGEKRLTVFTAPDDLKGTKVLILSPAQMYVYLPAFGKVRRIASNTDQSAFGMAFSQDDLATTTFSGTYDATVASSTKRAIKLALTPKPDQTTPYAKIELTIATDKQLPTEIKYYATDGKLVKTETRSGYTCETGVCTAGKLKMVDHRTQLTTTIVRKKWKLNESLADDLFAKTNLDK